MSKQIQSKAQAAHVTVTHDDPPGYTCLTLSERGANGRYHAIESLCIPNDTIDGVIEALTRWQVSKSDDTAKMGEALERLAREFTKHSGPFSSDSERDAFSRDLRTGALRYARAYYAEAKELGLIPEYAVVAASAPPPAPIEIAPSDVRVGDVLVAWRLGESQWSTIGMRGDTRVVERGQSAAIVASGDTITLAGYVWQVRRS